MLRISNDLERIGDLAENIALKAKTLGDEFRPNSVMLQIDAHVLTYMLENPRNIASCLGLSLCAKDLKRMRALTR